ncbi:oxidoreductase [Asanoa ishikariensis]|uniref:Probable oxidoreductase n=1 Tax=Asanoa ishikariensis TaxID=137265 RepID=A0A1H3MXV9_9ACTN|nr:SDR family NAD(P)-dependent oxidoreductase [Asanoa ishikariensis]GIF68983.1 oxidoreductase [Asanoa ishikariensis]SDY81354.1 NAD(P)-dependent dehydrogenase, short-chain alcohol dehydrogenase family [Asanoa ishikariensis]
MNASSTTNEILAGIDLSAKRAIVTGGGQGIGFETARALAAAGAEVLLTARGRSAATAAAAEIAAKTGNPAVRGTSLELTDGASVAGLVAGWTGPLHILINNAGIMALPELHRTAEGWELQFATNHLGHFALATGLHRALAAAGGARVVAVSSNGHRTSPVVFGDINFTSRAYDPWLAYGQSKTANVLFAVEAASRWADDGVVANALMPGGVRSNLQAPQLANVTPEIQAVFDSYPWKTVEQGAATSVLLAASPLVDGVTGRYYEDCAPAVLTMDPDAQNGVRPHALDPEDAARLWEVSRELLSAR